MNKLCFYYKKSKHFNLYFRIPSLIAQMDLALSKIYERYLKIKLDCYYCKNNQFTNSIEDHTCHLYFVFEEIAAQELLKKGDISQEEYNYFLNGSRNAE